MTDLGSGIDFNRMDKNIRPQDDFYRHVNGKWLDEFVIPADKSNYGTFTALYEIARENVKAIIEEAASEKNVKGSNNQKVGDLYLSFMDTVKLEELGPASLSEELAIVESIHNISDLSEFMAYADIVASSPFTIYVSIDDKNPNRYITFLSQSGLGLPDRDFYLNTDDYSQNIRSEYINHIDRMLGLHGFGNTRQMAQTVMDIETQLADNHWTKEKNRDPVKTYNLFSYDEVKTMIPSLNWDHWERATGINGLTEIVVHQPDYLTALETILVSTPVEDWKTYYKWRLITASASFMSADIDQENFHFYRNVLSGVKKQEPRWKRGVSVVNGTIGEIIGKIYVERHFNAEAKRRMTKLVENLRQAFEVGINELEWMSDNTKVQAQDKLRKFRPKIGYPNKWKDYSKIIINADDLLGNMKNVTLVLTKQNRDKLGQPVDRDEWFMTPQTVNAYYNPALNEIVFPAAILQPPFFNLEADDAVNYGAIGAVIGHEMGHGFDDSGSQYDGDGALRNWWKSEDRDEFNNRTKMLIDQYNQFTVVNGTSVNGEFTQGENIGDLTGATIAYKAYQISKEDSKSSVIDGLTGEQRFFYGWGRIWSRKYRNEELLKRIKTDPHSPGEFRANGPLVNMPEFIKAFDLKAGDKMYLDRDKRVKIW